MSIRNFEHHTPQIASNCYIDATATIIGNVDVASYASIWPQVVIRGDVHRITIGEGSNIQDGSILHCTHDGPYTPGGLGLKIGNHVTVGHMAMLHAANISNHCLIGMGAIVLDGAEIQAHSLIAAGSLVPPDKKLESGYLWMGRPVKKVRALDEQDIAKIIYSAEHYIRLAKRHLAS